VCLARREAGQKITPEASGLASGARIEAGYFFFFFAAFFVAKILTSLHGLEISRF
jgi:hypothetical protein